MKPGTYDDLIRRPALAECIPTCDPSDEVPEGALSDDAEFAQRALQVTSQTILVIEPRALIRDCLVRCLQGMRKHDTVLAFRTIGDWREQASKFPLPSLIVLSTGARKVAEMHADSAKVILADAEEIAPIVYLSDLDDPEQILGALDDGAKGFIPTTISLDVAVGAMQLVQAGGMFVPASSLISSRRSIEEAAAASKDRCAGLFTARQAAIVQALRQGKANKRIAYDLNMCESTVKVHIRNIMKKLKATNRTQVAFLTNGLFEATEERP